MDYVPVKNPNVPPECPHALLARAGDQGAACILYCVRLTKPEIDAIVKSGGLLHFALGVHEHCGQVIHSQVSFFPLGPPSVEFPFHGAGDPADDGDRK